MKGNQRSEVVTAQEFDKEAWQPKTAVGRKVKEGIITSIDEVLESGQRIMEAHITDVLVPNMSGELILIGQAKGKFGGGQRRVFKQTQKKTAEGNKPKFATLMVVGNKDGIIGLGYGKAKETVPAREKALRNAKLNVFRIRRGSGSWESNTTDPHSIPFTVEGKCGSVRVRLMPAPKGTGLKAQSELQKIFVAAGIKDIRSRVDGMSRTTINLVNACEDALRKLTTTKTNPSQPGAQGITEGGKRDE